ncbi:galactokinase [Beutenbergia cavernae DSM 12333]|uniref:Galactokinase n=1 Tax=Beutenbergia cavernae (strain ATCC BAA-8 / DSM 12333 / CCUG 43141 / JCM 11478 / NBRC 16432 / NCIMB 13614 / HKI 0122) TaxID=471853 RepID=C5BZ90_BEUC1|nr:galactokinase [Beutenbergia cavernae]ACQ81205.1 galactokinase [Beutenbergia cavernae DSM 12333]
MSSTSGPEWLTAWSDDDGAARVASSFASVVGGAAEGVWSAPGRVNLIGEHTDYNGGLCLPIAIEHRTFVALRRRDDGVVRLASAQRDGVWEVALDGVAPGTVHGWGAYVAGVAWALAGDGHDVPGFDAVVDSCVPFGAGLSSSAALESAFAVALDDLLGLGLAADDAGRARLAAACVRAENEIAGAPTGGMDQAASLRSRARHALLLDCLDLSVTHVPYDASSAGLELLVVDTRAPHSHVDGEYAERRDATHAAALALGVPTLREWLDADRSVDDAVAALPDAVSRRRVRHVLTEIGRTRDFVTALTGGDWERAGRLMDASHASLRDDYEVTVPELDTAVETARSEGAVGARMTGGGFGGSAIALVPAGTAGAVATSVAAEFARHGFAPPAFLTSDAAAPAARVTPV